LTRHKTGFTPGIPLRDGPRRAVCTARRRLHGVSLLFALRFTPKIRFVMHTKRRVFWCLAGVALLALAAGMTATASDFLTEGADSARTGWLRDEKIFTTANVALKTLLW
jgi:hypothetical protein